MENVLSQKEVNFAWDIIVVDNESGSENDTERMIRKLNHPRILYYRNRENLGVDGNYNRCIFLARGAWVAMLHADDLVTDDHLLLMGKYIREGSKGRKKLAYISPAYMEFSDIEKVDTKRPDMGKMVYGWQEMALLNRMYHGRLKTFRQLDGVISGYSVGLPSFGTVMNREIMIKEGGFDEKLGICEDVITPYRLAKKYRVCVTPEIMGFYRFGTNYSMKPEVILKIFESMSDFREYMYIQSLPAKWLGRLVRNQHNEELIEYCIKLSRFSNRRLTIKDFNDMYVPVKQSVVSVKLVRGLKNLYRRANGISTNIEQCNCYLQNVYKEIAEAQKVHTDFIIYGAGMAGKCTYTFLKKHFKNVNILCYAVTGQTGTDKIGVMPVLPLEKLKKYRKTAVVITATIIIEYQREMLVELEKNEFENVIYLMK